MMTSHAMNEEMLRPGVAVVSVYLPDVQHVDRLRRRCTRHLIVEFMKHRVCGVGECRIQN